MDKRAYKDAKLNDLDAEVSQFWVSITMANAVLFYTFILNTNYGN